MRYFIIFGITFILAAFIIFYKPYLAVYEDSITIEYNYNEENYKWSYKINNDNLSLVDQGENKWVFTPNKNGKTNIVFEYSNGEKTLYTIDYEFKIKNNKIFWTKGSAKGLLSYPNPI